MNLVAKEYVAAQEAEDPGVLVLSEFAGAAAQLDAALIVNPMSREDVAEAIRRALSMPVEERRERWQALIGSVRGECVTKWRDDFVRALQAAAEPTPDSLPPDALTSRSGDPTASTARQF
jgi:trehalose 6-phosphate synthase